MSMPAGLKAGCWQASIGISFPPLSKLNGDGVQDLTPISKLAGVTINGTISGVGGIAAEFVV